jgi:hypothetical protein
MFPACFDCIHYKEPKSVNNLHKFNDISYCSKYKDYAERSRENEKNCGLSGKGFDPKNSKNKNKN